MYDLLGALRRGDFEAAAGLLDPDVSWQGLREEWVCHGRGRIVRIDHYRSRGEALEAAGVAGDVGWR
jgi:hypothetical protein